MLRPDPMGLKPLQRDFYENRECFSILCGNGLSITQMNCPVTGLPDLTKSMQQFNFNIVTALLLAGSRIFFCAEILLIRRE